MVVVVLVVGRSVCGGESGVGRCLGGLDIKRCDVNEWGWWVCSSGRGVSSGGRAVGVVLSDLVLRTPCCFCMGAVGADAETLGLCAV